MKPGKMAALVGISALLTSAVTLGGPAEPDETIAALQQQIEALTRRVEGLERQLQAARAPQPTAPRPTAAPVSASASREEALALYRMVDGLMATGNIQQAHREVDQYNDKYAGTNAAAWTRSLSRELEVVGKQAPADWTIEKWYQGESEVTLDGSRPTLVVFWESWCPHCRDEVPKVQQLYESYKDRGLQVVGVTRLTRTATDDTVLAFLQENHITYPNAKETGDLAGYFNVKGIPAAALVENGKIVWRGHPIRLTDELMGIWF